MADPFATWVDVAARWRPLSQSEQDVADVLCADATSLICQRFPGIDGQVASGQVDPIILTMVTANMVRRAMIAPSDGISQQSETVGPFSRSQSYANPLGNVFLTQQELTLILGYQPSGFSGRFSNTTDHIEDSYVAYVYNGGVDASEVQVQ